jgi:hypothetical protein
MERDILDDSVALVEDSEHRDTLRHRRDAALARRGRRDLAGRGGRILLRAASTGGQRKREQQRSSEPRHAYSGIHGS